MHKTVLVTTYAGLAALAIFTASWNTVAWLEDGHSSRTVTAHIDRAVKAIPFLLFVAGYLSSRIIDGFRYLTQSRRLWLEALAILFLCLGHLFWPGR